MPLAIGGIFLLIGCLLVLVPYVSSLAARRRRRGAERVLADDDDDAEDGDGGTVLEGGTVVGGTDEWWSATELSRSRKPRPGQTLPSWHEEDAPTEVAASEEKPLTALETAALFGATKQAVGGVCGGSCGGGFGSGYERFSPAALGSSRDAAAASVKSLLTPPKPDARTDESRQSGGAVLSPEEAEAAAGCVASVASAFEEKDARERRAAVTAALARGRTLRGR